MMLWAEDNRLFCDGEEMREYVGTHVSSGPAHEQRIRCFGVSPKESRYISLCEAGRIKIWDPSLPQLERKVWQGDGHKDVIAVGVNDDGRRMAVACGLKVTIYEIWQYYRLTTELVCLMLPLKDKVWFIKFKDDNHVVCHDGEGNKVTIEHDPEWRIKG